MLGAGHYYNTTLRPPCTIGMQLMYITLPGMRNFALAESLTRAISKPPEAVITRVGVNSHVYVKPTPVIIRVGVNYHVYVKPTPVIIRVGVNYHVYVKPTPVIIRVGVNYHVYVKPTPAVIRVGVNYHVYVKPTPAVIRVGVNYHVYLKPTPAIIPPAGELADPSAFQFLSLNHTVIWSFNNCFILAGITRAFCQGWLNQPNPLGTIGW